MAVTIQQIIAAINPDLYYDYGDDKGKLNKFKELIKEKGPYRAVAETIDQGGDIKPKPVAEHVLGYDSSSETLEPVYFFILDLMGDFGFSAEKLVDNFTASPGSGHFAELGQRATIMQQNASKIMGDVNNVLRSVLNIIYDLKEFKLRLGSYDDLKNPEKKDAATLSLKQIWMDKVDMQKGQSSIKAMALGQAQFVTLINAFLSVKDSKQVDELDLNDVVKRILKPRILEFNSWVVESEKELRKRYEIERTYLKAQVNNLKLYAKWVKPYLRAAQQLSSADRTKDAELVNVFNTILLQLTLLGKSKVEVQKSALAGELPEEFKTLKTKRNYYDCMIIDFRFRGIPQRISQQPHYVFGGKVDVTFSAYSLNDDELKKLDKEIEKDDVGDTLKLVEGIATESLGSLQEEIDFFLNEKEKETAEEKKTDETNPFLALIGFYNKKSSGKSEEKKAVKPEDEPLKYDDWNEQIIRKMSQDSIKKSIYAFFDTYKKVHGMASFT